MTTITLVSTRVVQVLAFGTLPVFWTLRKLLQRFAVVALLTLITPLEIEERTPWTNPLYAWRLPLWFAATTIMSAFMSPIVTTITVTLMSRFMSASMAVSRSGPRRSRSAPVGLRGGLIALFLGNFWHDFFQLRQMRLNGHGYPLNNINLLRLELMNRGLVIASTLVGSYRRNTNRLVRIIRRRVCSRNWTIIILTRTTVNWWVSPWSVQPRHRGAARWISPVGWRIPHLLADRIRSHVHHTALHSTLGADAIVIVMLRGWIRRACHLAVIIWGSRGGISGVWGGIGVITRTLPM